MKIGYARVTTRDQNLDLQIDALKKAGCDDTYIYMAQITGATRDGSPAFHLLSRRTNRIRKYPEIILYADRLHSQNKDRSIFGLPAGSLPVIRQCGIVF
ncbi:MAG: recombinase family protein [Saprospiraceae bacterium]